MSNVFNVLIDKSGILTSLQIVTCALLAVLATILRNESLDKFLARIWDLKTSWKMRRVLSTMPKKEEDVLRVCSLLLLTRPPNDRPAFGIQKQYRFQNLQIPHRDDFGSFVEDFLE